MVRRWVIRGICAALLALCMAAWVGSYWRAVRVVRFDNMDMFYGVEVNWGRIHGFRMLSTGPSLPRWVVSQVPPKQGWAAADAGANFHGLGFAFRNNPMSGFVMIPLWFPALVSAGLLWLVWRRTRPKYDGRGFPVETGNRDNVTRCHGET
jgi:hypothetical protein